jgi:hypothetical protein
LAAIGAGGFYLAFYLAHIWPEPTWWQIPTLFFSALGAIVAMLSGLGLAFLGD